VLLLQGSNEGIDIACEMKEAEPKRWNFRWRAFHSPLMEPAREELAAAIEATEFSSPFVRFIKT
jgi:[acyl-carrier-protein] S-malonyltransferase